MSTQNKSQSLQSLMDSGNIVDRLYRSPPKNALTIFTQMMPGDVVRPEFTTWRDEQRSWRETVALHDQSYHMHNLRVRGKHALRVFERLAVIAEMAVRVHPVAFIDKRQIELVAVAVMVGDGLGVVPRRRHEEH